MGKIRKVRLDLLCETEFASDFFLKKEIIDGQNYPYFCLCFVFKSLFNVSLYMEFLLSSHFKLQQDHEQTTVIYKL